MRKYLIFILFALILDCYPESFIDSFTYKVNARVREIKNEITTLNKTLASLPSFLPSPQGIRRGVHTHFQSNQSSEVKIFIDLGAKYNLDFLALVPVSINFQGKRYDSYGYPLRFKIEVSAIDKSGEYREVFNTGANDYTALKAYPLLVKTYNLRTRYICITVFKHWKRDDGKMFSAFSELFAISGKRNVAINAIVSGPFATFEPHWASKYLVDGQTSLGLPVSKSPSRTNGFLAQKNNSLPKWILLDLGEIYNLDDIRLVPSQPIDAPSFLNYGFPLEFEIITSKDLNFSTPKIIYRRQKNFFPFTEGNVLTLKAENIEARYIKIMAYSFITKDPISFALAELQVYAQNKNIALNKKIYVSDSFNHPQYNQIWNKRNLVDGFSSQNKLIEINDWLMQLEKKRIIEGKVNILENELDQDKASFSSAMIIFVCLLGTLSLLLATNSVYQRRKKTKIALEKLRTQIARDLHDDLGSRLGGIRLLSEAMLNDSELSEEVRIDWQSINESSTNAIEAMRDIVWLTDGKDISSLKMSAHLNQISRELLYNLKLNWKQEVISKRITFERRRQIILSFREVIGNIIKHSQATSVSIYIKCDAKYFVFSIEDNGIGFDFKQNKFGRGLNNLKHRANSLDGSCQIVTEPNNGTSILFTVKIG